jgi:hypothetical protein
MDIQLIVVRPFDGLTRGDAVTEPTRIVRILNSEWVHSVVRILVASSERD